ncbi:MAG TPA: hypothetical protein VGW38_01665, partial [Chloroflexota bacterium]|nr:hypothetical protein [Chloroflexota bacterium]
AAVVLAMILLTAPLHWLLGFDAYTLILTAHAVLGTALVVVATIAASMGYRLAIHHLPSFGWLMGMASAAAALAGTLAVLGNILYAGYLRSGGPMEQLIKKAPEAHKVLFEFKEYVGLFPFPLAVASAFIVWFYREDLRRDRQLAEMVATLLLLVVFFSLLPFGLGAAVVRLRGIL